MKSIKVLIIFTILIIGFLLLGSVYGAVGVPPSYKNNFSKYLISSEPDKEGRVETVYDLGIDSSKSLRDNIRCLFYPNAYMVPGCDASSAGGKIWDVMRYVGFSILVIFLTMVGIELLTHGIDTEKVKTALKSLMYILYGSILFFGATWILGSSLGVETIQGSEGMVGAIQGGPGSLFFKVISALKAFAFFIAIIMIIIFGFKIMAASDQSEKTKTALKGVVNVVIALVIIKIIDYLYYIVQLPSFTTQATDFIIEVAKILGFIIGAFLVIMVFYSGYLFITDQGKTENMKKAKNILIGIVLSALVIFMLLLIMYQVFAEFT